MIKFFVAASWEDRKIAEVFDVSLGRFKQ